MPEKLGIVKENPRIFSNRAIHKSNTTNFNIFDKRKQNRIGDQEADG